MRLSKLFSNNKNFPVFTILVPLFACLAILFGFLIRNGNLQLLYPAGYVADFQSRLLWGAIIFAAIVGSLIIATCFIIVFHYREGKHAKYEPDWTAGSKFQLAGWGIPLIAVIVLSVFIWNTAQLVDPYRPISSSTSPITVQVVALRYKWLFIYPNDGIATVNFMEIPANTPVNLQLTADAPMNSFWIPRLSGQIYAMTGMVTQLHIEADRSGVYAGSPAEISGDDFAGMDFTVKAVTSSDYQRWKRDTKDTANSLDYAAYTQLAKPSSYNQSALYKVPDTDLFQIIVMQYMVSDANLSGLNSQGVII